MSAPPRRCRVNKSIPHAPTPRIGPQLGAPKQSSRHAAQVVTRGAHLPHVKMAAPLLQESCREFPHGSIRTVWEQVVVGISGILVPLPSIERRKWELLAVSLVSTVSLATVACSLMSDVGGVTRQSGRQRSTCVLFVQMAHSHSMRHV